MGYKSLYTLSRRWMTTLAEYDIRMTVVETRKRRFGPFVIRLFLLSPKASLQSFITTQSTAKPTDLLVDSPWTRAITLVTKRSLSAEIPFTPPFEQAKRSPTEEIDAQFWYRYRLLVEHRWCVWTVQDPVIHWPQSFRLMGDSLISLFGKYCLNAMRTQSYYFSTLVRRILPIWLFRLRVGQRIVFLAYLSWLLGT
jgi:hypothetical protein